MKNTFQIKITGLVQGVGFRPFILRLANQMELTGEVENRNDGVYIEISASQPELSLFIDAIRKQAPAAASIDEITFNPFEAKAFNDFSIVFSKNVSESITEISPDIAVCKDCIHDMRLQKHRIDYPFINCTHCGPRFTIIRDLPYDREHTTMSVFPLCETCREEYNHVIDRRFHAQPVACNHCGPHYTLVQHANHDTNIHRILSAVSVAIEQGKILAIKGLGGYHLMCDAFRQEAVAALRNLKQRESKPFAVMCKDMEGAGRIAFISSEEEISLQSWQRPIVLLNSRYIVAPGVSNGLDKIGIMLPYLPMHYLLFEHLKTSCIVLTSGNLSDEPIIIDNDKAVQTFQQITEAVLINNRDIHNRCDDSVVSIVEGHETVIRRSRGYVPSPIKSNLCTEGIFGAGAELVNCFGLGKGNHIMLSQHIGDLKNAETYDFYKETYQRFSRLFKFKPQLLVSDLHPDYLSGVFAKELSDTLQIPMLQVQHHHAHIAACMAEHGLDEPVIGISMDGVGLGTDGHIWGGEFMITTLDDFNRAYQLEYIPISGGDKVTHEPWRSALAYVYYYFGKEGLEKVSTFLKNVKPTDVELYERILEKKIHTFHYSSAGRLFDAVAALTGICTHAGFHAEAPMRLESAIDKSIADAYPFEIIGDVISFKPVFAKIIEDKFQQVSVPIISAKFHNTLIRAILEVSQLLKETSGIRNVALSGGTFQNHYLLSQLIKAFSKRDFNLYFPQQIPANDGGIALGQVTIGAKKRQLGKVT